MIIGKFQRNRDGNFVDYIDVPEFMQMIWFDALDR
jgi:hypothetical protein